MSNHKHMHRCISTLLAMQVQVALNWPWRPLRLTCASKQGCCIRSECNAHPSSVIRSNCHGILVDFYNQWTFAVHYAVTKGAEHKHFKIMKVFQPVIAIRVLASRRPKMLSLSPALIKWAACCKSRRSFTRPYIQSSAMLNTSASISARTTRPVRPA